MIQTVSIDPADYDTIRQAAHADGIGYADKLANIIANYAKAYRLRSLTHEDHPHDCAGIVAGGD